MESYLCGDDGDGGDGHHDGVRRALRQALNPSCLAPTPGGARDDARGVHGGSLLSRAPLPPACRALGPQAHCLCRACGAALGAALNHSHHSLQSGTEHTLENTRQAGCINYRLRREQCNMLRAYEAWHADGTEQCYGASPTAYGLQWHICCLLGGQ